MPCFPGRSNSTVGSGPVVVTRNAKSHAGKAPNGRFWTAAELGGTVAFLVGDDAGFITGAAVAADGAWGHIT
jgi:NAD(P)-dependent dehydrogenase (short-subunit alcohol dehydrogenase family)